MKWRFPSLKVTDKECIKRIFCYWDFFLFIFSTFFRILDCLKAHNEFCPTLAFLWFNQKTIVMSCTSQQNQSSQTVRSYPPITQSQSHYCHFFGEASFHYHQDKSLKKKTFGRETWGLKDVSPLIYDHYWHFELWLAC